jgi:endonuclease/exonuclease/phosphatase family metal-dependent hydrolase
MVRVTLLLLSILTPLAAFCENPAREQQLKVLTWNVFLRPRAILWGDYQSARAREMVQLLQEEDYDVVILQEAFDGRSLRILTEGLKEHFPYFILPEKRNFFHTNSGLLVLSRLPFEKVDRVFFDQCTGADCMADKGAVLVQVTKGGRTYQVIGTHAQAEEGRKYAEIRAHQYGQIREALLEAHVQEGVTQLVVGDLNTDQSQHLEYNMMLHMLGTEDGEVAHGDDGAPLRDDLAGSELRRVVGADGGADLLMHGGDRFAGGGLAEVALPQKRHGGHDGSAEIDDVGFARVAEDMHVEAFQQLTRRVEVGGGVVIAAGDDGLHRFKVGEALQKVEVERHRILWRIRGVEDIAADDQRVNFLAAERFDEPVEKRGMLWQPLALDEPGAEMPVCSVEDAHGAM